jgi:lysosomal acid lipase/cholesteryl ester hydrolase
VVTDDNYILGVYHLLGRQTNVLRGLKPAVFLMHGLLCSHYDWMMLGDKSLPYMLHDAGYDVWMGNSRGNAYSKNNLAWGAESQLFWDFSWHEMGVYDLPAMIDFVLNVTRQEKLFYVGHSQGAAQFYVLAAERPEYNDKIIAMHGLASGGFLSHMRSPFAPILSKEMQKAADFFKRIGLHQLTATPQVLRESGLEPNDICGDESPMQNMCACLIYLVCGFNTDQFNKSIVPKIMLTTSAGASLKQVAHFLQLYKSHKFRQFDYGEVGNMERYNKPEPPNYKLKNIKAPVYLHYSLNDWLASPIVS